MESQQSRFLDLIALKQAFINQLNTIYRAKTHLLNHLPDLKEKATFLNLKYALEEEFVASENQLQRLEKIFELLKLNPSGTDCLAIDAILEEAFMNVDRNNADTFQSDVALSFYMQIIEHVEMGGLRMLKQISPKLEDPEIQQLLLESFDEAKDSAKLFNMISQEYISADEEK